MADPTPRAHDQVITPQELAIRREMEARVDRWLHGRTKPAATPATPKAS